MSHPAVTPSWCIPEAEGVDTFLGRLVQRIDAARRAERRGHRLPPEVIRRKTMHEVIERREVVRG